MHLITRAAALLPRDCCIARAGWQWTADAKFPRGARCYPPRNGLQSVRQTAVSRMELAYIITPSEWDCRRDRILKCESTRTRTSTHASSGLDFNLFFHALVNGRYFLFKYDFFLFSHIPFQQLVTSNFALYPPNHYYTFTERYSNYYSNKSPHSLGNG